MNFLDMEKDNFSSNEPAQRPIEQQEWSSRINAIVLQSLMGISELVSIGILDQQKKTLQMLDSGQTTKLSGGWINQIDDKTVTCCKHSLEETPVEIIAKICPKLTVNGKTSKTAVKIKEKLALTTDSPMTLAFRGTKFLFEGYSSSQPLNMCLKEVRLSESDNNRFKDIKSGDILEFTTETGKKVDLKVIQIIFGCPKNELNVHVSTTYEIAMSATDDQLNMIQPGIDTGTVVCRTMSSELVSLYDKMIYSELLDLGYKNHQYIISHSNEVLNLGDRDYTYKNFTLPAKKILKTDKLDKKLDLGESLICNIMRACDLLRVKPDDKFFVISNPAMAAFISYHLQMVPNDSPLSPMLDTLYDTGIRLNDNIKWLANVYLRNDNRDIIVGRVNDKFNDGYGLIVNWDLANIDIKRDRVQLTDNKGPHMPYMSIGNKIKMTSSAWSSISCSFHPEWNYISFHADFDPYELGDCDK